MERILSCLAYWSPIFEDLDYLPSLVFPFVKVFWNDLFSCLEVVMTVLGDFIYMYICMQLYLNMLCSELVSKMVGILPKSTSRVS